MIKKCHDTFNKLFVRVSLQYGGIGIITPIITSFRVAYVKLSGLLIKLKESAHLSWIVRYENIVIKVLYRKELIRYHKNARLTVV
jgi:hypothetical protein